jgi:hypothetical protein
LNSEVGMRNSEGGQRDSEIRIESRLELSYERRRWPRASSHIEKETLKKRITNIEQGIMNVEVRYSIDLY